MKRTAVRFTDLEKFAVITMLKKRIEVNKEPLSTEEFRERIIALVGKEISLTSTRKLLNDFEIPWKSLKPRNIVIQTALLTLAVAIKNICEDLECTTDPEVEKLIEQLTE